MDDVSQRLKSVAMPMHPMRPVVTTGTRAMVRFRINYSTRWGENVIIVGSTDELGGLQDPTEDEVRVAIAAGKGKVMRYIADGNWEYATLMSSAPTEIVYRYALVRERGHPLIEGGIRAGRILDLDECVRRTRTSAQLSLKHNFPKLIEGSRGSSASIKDAAGRDGPVQIEVRDQWRVSRRNGEDVILRTEAVAAVICGSRRSEMIEEAILDGTLSHVSELYKPPPPARSSAAGESGERAEDASLQSGIGATGEGREAGRGREREGERQRAIPFRLTVERTRVPLGCAMAVECDALLRDAAVMSCERFPEWELDLLPPPELLPAAYKYIYTNILYISILLLYIYYEYI